MSGIVGIYYLDGHPVDRGTLGRMLDVQAHRGPDGSDIWCTGAVGLGHCMLHTTPESLHETLPLVGASGAVVLTADARIDNREELIRALGRVASNGHVLTDSELILAAYERWGRACPEYLLGDFAFAIWDGRKQRLFCARDHFGIRNLYYHHAPGRLFTFATEIKSLVQLDEVPRTYDDVWIARHLLVPTQKDYSRTPYKGIFSLDAGHSLTVESSGIHVQRYWELDPSRQTLLSSDEEYAEALREIFLDAVRCRMRTAFPLASMLSGGLDSSSIASTAAYLQQKGEGTQQRIHSLSAVFDTVTECDERPYIEMVLEKYRLEPHFMTADRHSLLGDLDHVHRHLEKPLEGHNTYIFWHLYQVASQHGCRVVLEGFDGDSAISHGFGYWYELAGAGKWFSLLKEVREYANNIGEPSLPAMWTWVHGRAIMPFIARSRALSLMRGAWKTALRSARKSTGSSRYKPDLLQVVHPDLLARVQEVQGVPDRAPASEKEAHYHRLTSFALIEGLKTYAAAAAASSIEVRMPFFDKRLLEFCLSIPARQKMNGGYSRVIMRRAMEGILPREIQWRATKSNMAPSVVRSLRVYEGDRLAKVVSDDLGNISQYVNSEALQRLYQWYGEGEDAINLSGVQVWRILTLAVWLQHNEATTFHPSNSRKEVIAAL